MGTFIDSLWYFASIPEEIVWHSVADTFFGNSIRFRELPT